MRRKPVRAVFISETSMVERYRAARHERRLLTAGWLATIAGVAALIVISI